uniref:Uncharacterized protein n=1 Tax=Anguilla anguilla TaxID=7936 RepID=A0A0E9V579_ANGAN
MLPLVFLVLPAKLFEYKAELGVKLAIRTRRIKQRRFHTKKGIKAEGTYEVSC